MKRASKVIKAIICIVVILTVLLAGGVFGVNAYIKDKAGERILTPEAAAELEGVDCILVLGCLVHSDGEPSDMLHDRLQRGVELYKAGAAPKLLMSGDHGRTDYNEVAAMKQYAIDAGIPSEDVFMDHAGFSTYESIYRAKEIFGADKIIIVTQQYHLYRALYAARAMGIEAYGVASDYHSYVGQSVREIREVLARVKDFGTGIFQPKPTYLGEFIPISGSGDLTND
jgi:vancomycin permeability regulator SanA